MGKRFEPPEHGRRDAVEPEQRDLPLFWRVRKRASAAAPRRPRRLERTRLNEPRSVEAPAAAAPPMPGGGGSRTA
eukprot:7176558-Pyramimonas_sp.AAC.1